MSINRAKTTRMNKLDMVFDTILRIQSVVHEGKSLLRKLRVLAKFGVFQRMATFAHIRFWRDDPTGSRPVQRALIVFELYSDEKIYIKKYTETILRVSYLILSMPLSA